MSDGYQRRPEEPTITQREWNMHAAVWSLTLLACCALVVVLSSEVRSLRRDLAEANRQLDYWTCRVQLDPMPMPEQVGEGPTLIEDDANDIIIPPVEIDEAVPVTNSVGATPRSNKWPTVRARYVAEHPACEACGVTKALNVHHCQPFHGHPELELDPENLITLCRDCHFTIGHDPDGEGPLKPSWKAANPNVRRDAAKKLSKTTVVP